MARFRTPKPSTEAHSGAIMSNKWRDLEDLNAEVMQMKLALAEAVRHINQLEQIQIDRLNRERIVISSPAEPLS